MSRIPSSASSYPDPTDVDDGPPRWSPAPLRQLLRHRSAYWVAAALLAVVVALSIQAQTTRARRVVDRLGQTTTVVVTDGAVEPGDGLVDRIVMWDVPVGLVPQGAMTDLPPGATAGRRLASGSIVTDLDLSGGDRLLEGEAALAVPTTATPPVNPGDRAVLVIAADPFSGLEGRLIDARVLETSEERVVIALSRADLPDAAAALRLGVVTLAAA